MHDADQAVGVERARQASQASQWTERASRLTGWAEWSARLPEQTLSGERVVGRAGKAGADGVLAAELDQARQGRKIKLALMKGSDLQADLVDTWIGWQLGGEPAHRARIDSRTGGRKVLPTKACPISV